ncbi:hypothetical protein B296_00025354 [Ensete ventricosum]|uniref:Uncharacterized protein n=2 Tax=Ensete ventricosum TaxID=4639 RepID=A0A427AHT9_ENSVE|nr:hypothetical protein B296_00025354 [Ensete ventricosum]
MKTRVSLSDKDRSPRTDPFDSRRSSQNPSPIESLLETGYMGLLSWWKGKGASPSSATNGDTGKKPAVASEEVPGMNGAVEVRRPADVTVFEFGSVAAFGDRMTLAGYCPVSDDLEPCRWEIIPAAGPDAPQFRIVF